MSRYLVAGPHVYLGTTPGDEFEADLPTDMETRAIARGDIRVIEDSPVTLQPGTVRLADGWHLHAQEG